MGTEGFSWTVKEVGEFIGRPSSWVYDNVRKLGIPHIKVGQGVRFRPSEVAEWAESQRGRAA